MRILLSLAAGLLVTSLSIAASANGTGATGYSGKQAGQTCNSCHTGGTAPTVTFTGPATLAPGATGDYKLEVVTAQVAAGANIATDTATLAAGPGMKLVGGELTHTAGAPAIAGTSTFTFKVTAPASGAIKLFAAGLASDGNGTGGDTAVQITKDITVVAATPGTPATPGAPAMPGADDDNDADPAADVKTDTSGTEPTTAKSKKKKTADDDEPDSYQRERAPMANVGMTCAATHAGSSAPNDATVGAGALLVLGAVLIKRRARRQS